jgi:hypothetical protein
MAVIEALRSEVAALRERIEALEKPSAVLSFRSF